jgi:hypothetical protein
MLPRVSGLFHGLRLNNDINMMVDKLYCLEGDGHSVS